MTDPDWSKIHQELSEIAVRLNSAASDCEEGVVLVKDVKRSYLLFDRRVRRALPEESRPAKLYDRLASTSIVWPASVDRYASAPVCGYYRILLTALGKTMEAIERDSPVTGVIPEASEFFLRTQPYQRFAVDATSVKSLLAVEFFDGVLDCYCPGCQRHTVYKSTVTLPDVGHAMMPQEPESVSDLLERHSKAWFCPPGESSYKEMTFSEYGLMDRLIVSRFRCTRDAQHELVFFSRVNDRQFSKVGQDPSIADLELPEVQKYRSVLKDQYTEFTKAVGLAAHGVGIGSFMYLRRIFENLIEEAHRAAEAGPSWNEEEYRRSRMSEKIGLLADHLPEFLVDNREIYGILSTGIHELTEEDCLKYYSQVRIGIELILDEKLQDIEKRKKLAAASRDLKTITQNLRTSEG